MLERFLSCASEWADHIVIADQASNDGSREMARSFSKVILVDNCSSTYSELQRQQLLINTARQINGPRLLVALDADEMLTANVLDSNEWDMCMRATPGTVIQFQWINLFPDLRSYWNPGIHFAWGFMDDGSQHRGEVIHSTRVPVPQNAPCLPLVDVQVLHYQYTDWERMESKHRWYQCWERLSRPSRRPAEVYRQYHHMYGVRKSEIRSVRPEWFFGYVERGIDMTNIVCDHMFWWDQEVLSMLQAHGAEAFRREDIWEVDWETLARKLGREVLKERVQDPRRAPDKLAQHWLRCTQPYAGTIPIRMLDKALRLLGW